MHDVISRAESSGSPRLGIWRGYQDDADGKMPGLLETHRNAAIECQRHRRALASALRLLHKPLPIDGPGSIGSLSSPGRGRGADRWASDTRRFAILGNSGSGKSTLATWLAQVAELALLDLDSVAWEPDRPGVERPAALAEADVAAFCATHARWVIEGCYANLVAAALQCQPLLVFLNPGLESCTANCLTRPWEPHKYASKQDQDANLEFLLSWVAEYYTRDGPMSLQAHRELFARYPGRKVELRRVPELSPPGPEVLAWLR
jgi:adenylate kinase family enzyme